MKGFNMTDTTQKTTENSEQRQMSMLEQYFLFVLIISIIIAFFIAVNSFNTSNDVEQTIKENPLLSDHVTEKWSDELPESFTNYQFSRWIQYNNNGTYTNQQIRLHIVKQENNTFTVYIHLPDEAKKHINIDIVKQFIDQDMSDYISEKNNLSSWEGT